jgi:hypothetical protein
MTTCDETKTAAVMTEAKTARDSSRTDFKGVLALFASCWRCRALALILTFVSAADHIGWAGLLWVQEFAKFPQRKLKRLARQRIIRHRGQREQGGWQKNGELGDCFSNAATCGQFA